MNVDPLGDFYGDYGNYSIDDFGMDFEDGNSESTSKEDLTTGEDGVDDEAIDASLAGEK
jgi:hypothetical protein